jgi:hypothetical protein
MSFDFVFMSQIGNLEHRAKGQSQELTQALRNVSSWEHGTENKRQWNMDEGKNNGEERS